MSDMGDGDDIAPDSSLPDDGPDTASAESEPTDAPPTLPSLRRAANTAARPAQPTATPPAPNRDGPPPAAPSPRPTPPAPTRQGPPPPPPPPPGRRADAPSIASRAFDVPPPPPPPTADPDPASLYIPPPANEPVYPPNATPRPTPNPTDAPASAGVPPAAESAKSVNPPPAPPPPVDRPDLTELLERLHEDLDVEQSPAPTEPGEALTNPRDLERPTDLDKIVIESTGGIDFQPTFASFPQRILSAVADTIALALFVGPGVAVAIAGGGAGAVVAGAALSLLGFVVAMVSYARSIARSGRWIGNRIAGTRTVDVRNGDTIRAADAGARFAVRNLVSIVFLIGFLVAFGDSQRRTFHDRFAGTVVIARQRETWSAAAES